MSRKIADCQICLWTRKIHQFTLNKIMNNFNAFLINKNLDQLAEKCIREDVPIVEFVQWYEEEGQFFEGFWGDVGSGALKGAGVGGLAGGLHGVGLGGLAGGAYGAGKYLYNRLRGTPSRSIVDAKKEVIAALQKLGSMTGAHSVKDIQNIVDAVKKLSPKAPTEAPEAAAPVEELDPSLPPYWKDMMAEPTLSKFFNPNGSPKSRMLVGSNWATLQPLYSYWAKVDAARAKNLLDFIKTNNAKAWGEYEATLGHGKPTKPPVALAAAPTAAPVAGA